MVDFVVCPGCGLQHRARADGSCPRCTSGGSAGSMTPGRARTDAAESFEDSAAGRRLRVVLVGVIVLAATAVIFVVLSAIIPHSPRGGRGYGKLVILLGLAVVGVWAWGRKALSR